MWMAWNSTKPVADSRREKEREYRAVSETYIEPVTMGPYFHKNKYKQKKEEEERWRVSLIEATNSKYLLLREAQCVWTKEERNGVGPKQI